MAVSIFNLTNYAAQGGSGLLSDSRKCRVPATIAVSTLIATLRTVPEATRHTAVLAVVVLAVALISTVQ